MRRAALLLALVATGCYARHERGYAPSDGGVSPFEGVWLVDQPFHALYEATRYELAPDGRFIEECSISFGDPAAIPVGQVARTADGLRCELVGPWSSLRPEVLAIEGYCDDSVRRTVVLDVVWDGDRPSAVTLQKVDGEETGWEHPGFEWRWLPCGVATAGECEVCD
ncbi:MAG: hypothetical protein KC619_23070 [Myxococcales bacterium]|nr:hypothetical protein [Myxococcales bacterium]